MVMSSRERLLRAIHHQEPDSVPLNPRLGHYLIDYYGCACWAHFIEAAQEFDFDPIIQVRPKMSNYFFGHLSSTPSYIESLVEMNNYEDLQDVKVEINIERHRGYTISKRVIRTPAGILRDAVKIGEPIGPYGNCPYPHHLESILKKHEDLDRIRYLLPSPKRASFADIPIIKKIVGDNGLVSLRLEMGTDAYLADACGQVGAMTLYFDDKELLITLLRLFNDYIKSIIKMALEVGVDMVTDCWFNSSLSSGWSPAMYQELALPLIKGNIELVHSYGALYRIYDDGKWMTIAPWIAEVGADIISTLAPPPLGDADLELLKKEVGDKVCLEGGIDHLKVIKDGTPRTVRNAVREAIATAGPGGGYILGTADSIRETTPLENVKAYFEAGREFGRYPLSL